MNPNQNNNQNPQDDDIPLFADTPTPQIDNQSVNTSQPQNVNQFQGMPQNQPIATQYQPNNMYEAPKKKSFLSITIIAVAVLVVGLIIFRKFGGSEEGSIGGGGSTNRIYDVGQTFDAGYGVKITLSDIRIIDSTTNTSYAMKIDINNASSYNIMSAKDMSDIHLEFLCFNSANKTSSGKLTSDSQGQIETIYPLSRNGTYYLVCNRTYLDNNLTMVGLSLWNHAKQENINSYITEK